MNRRALGILFVAAAVAQAVPLAAQQAVVAPGTDVRLALLPSEEVRGSTEIHGRFLSWDADTLRVQEEASGLVRAVPSSTVERLRVSDPRTRGRGALRGLLIGSVVGALSFGALFASEDTGCFMCFSSSSEGFLYGLAFGGAAGGGVGAALGATWPGTRWEDVAAPR